MVTKELKTLLIIAHKMGITAITINSDEAGEAKHHLPSEDLDEITFHKGSESPLICDKLEICHQITTSEPIWKDWYMTSNYHS